ncbi:MAG: DUF4234 domain-containing protein [Clostridia bacterium]|nr:DUF4234 domain-containing protein [Clostridia bacterium]
MPFCTNCGKEILEGQKFCTNCGVPVEFAPVQNENTEPVQDENTQPNQNIDTQPIQNEENAQGGFYPPYGENAQPEGNKSFEFFQQPADLTAPVKSRSILTCILLSIVTCGIYGLYWHYCVVQDVAAASGKADDMSPAMVVLVSVITCGIYGWIWFYNAGSKVDEIKKRNGEQESSLSIIYLILAVCGLSIVDLALIQTELNKIAVE